MPKVFRAPSAFVAAGDFDQRVTIQRPTYNSPKDEITGYTPFATVWAKVESAIVSPARAASAIAIEADREVSLNYTLIRTPLIQGVDTTMQVVHQLIFPGFGNGSQTTTY